MHWPGLVLLLGTVAAFPQPNGWEDRQYGPNTQPSSKSTASSVAVASGLTGQRPADSIATYENKPTMTVTRIQTDTSCQDLSVPGNPGSSTQDDYWHDQTAMYHVPKPTATLLPARHWHTNPRDDKHFTPTETNNIYFSTDGTNSPKVVHQMAWLSAYFTSNAVLLDDSDRCTHTFHSSSNTLVVVFKDQSAFELARSLWHADIILVLNSDQCGTDANCYLKIVKLSFDEQSLTVTVEVSIIGFDKAVSYFDLEWGTYKPGKGSNKTRPEWPTNPGRPDPTDDDPPDDDPTDDDSEDYAVGGSSNDNCTAPIDRKHHLKTACLGQYFDEDLDDMYGYETIHETPFGDFDVEFPDIIYTDPVPDSDDSTDADSPTSRLKKRFLEFLGPGPLIEALVPGAAKVLPKEGLIRLFDKDLSFKKIDLTVPKERKLVDSPWGKQVLIKSFSKTGDNIEGKLDVYCVDCGVKGTADITGKIRVSLDKGPEEVSAELKADITITFKVGVDAAVTLTKNFDTQLFEVPLSPLCITGVVCVGPSLKLNADLELKATAVGQVLLGGSVSMHNAKAKLDLIKFQGEASGWEPEWKPEFQAKGKVELSADAGLPVSIALGLNILNGKWKIEVALVDRPALVGKAAVAGSIGPGGGGATPTDGCTGISTALEIKNDIYLSVPLRDKIYLHKTPPKKLVSGCIPLPAAPTTSTTSESTPTPTPTADDGGDAAAKQRRAFPLLTPRQFTNNTDTAISDDDNVVDNTAEKLATGTNSTEPYNPPADGDKAYNFTNGYEIATLVDTEFNYQVLPCSNGNLHLFGINETIPDEQCGDMWTMTTKEEAVIADGFSRLIVIYPDELAALGVTRVRVVDAENIPRGADAVIFIAVKTEVDDGDQDMLYYPVNNAGNTFFPIVCHYKDDQPSKVFLADDGDVDKGIKVLMGSDVKYSITGGDVDHCVYLPLIQGEGYDNESADDWLE